VWDWTAIIAIAAVTTLIVSGAAVLVRVVNRINDAQSEATEAKKTAETAATKFSTLETSFNNHCLSVARDYVSKDALRDVEGRILEAIRHLSDRLDKRFHQEGGEA
jgi:uncharacterized protein YpmS